MPNKFNEREQLLLELRMQLEPELAIISEHILKENLTAKLSYRFNEIFLIEIPLNRVFLTEIKLDDRIRTSVSFYQIIEDKYGYVSRVQISPNKKYVPQDILNLGRYYNGSYFLDINDSLSKLIVPTIRLILSERNPLIKMCQASSCYDRNGKLKKKFIDWRKDATLLYISKKMPLVHVVSGIPKSQQPRYDALPGVHGSNGTYAENASPYWALTYRVRRLAYEVDKSEYLTTDIHDYITCELMPRLGWKRMSADRLELLNSCIKGKRVSVVSHDMGEPPIYRSFSPENCSWNDFLDDFFKEL